MDNLKQILAQSARIVTSIRSDQGLNGPSKVNFKAAGQAAGAFKELTTKLPNIKAIPDAAAFQQPIGPLAGINSMITGLQSKYHLKIAGSEKGTSAQNLAAILNSGNKPLTKEQAIAQDYAWLNGYNQAERARRADPANNTDAEEIEKLQADIDEIKKRQNEDSSGSAA